MTKWTYGMRIVAGFMLVVALTIIMGIVAFLALRDAVDSKDAVIHETAANLADAERVRSALWEKVAHSRAFFITGDEGFIAPFTAADDRLSTALDTIAERGLSPEQTSNVAAIRRANAAHRKATDALLAARRAGTTVDALATRFEREVTPHFHDLEGAIKEFVILDRRILTDRIEESSGDAARAGALVIGIAILTALLAALVGLWLVRTLNRQLGDAVQHIRTSSAELKTTATQQAAGSKEQAVATGEVSTTVKELVASSREIALSAQRVGDLARDARDAADSGEETVRVTREAVDAIRVQVEAIVNHMLDLGGRSQQVGGIVDLIEELSDQANILAINATIEAAGAGDAGRRFAVVGEEVRKLADRVRTSTKEIRGLVEEMRAAVHTTVMATESGAKAVESGQRRFDALTTAFERVGAVVESTSDSAREIELSTKHQMTAVEQVNQAVANVAQAAREAETSSRQTASTAAELLTLSDALTRIVTAQPAARRAR